MNPRVRFTAEPRLALFLALAGLLWLAPGTTGTWLGVIALVLIILGVIADWMLSPSRHSFMLERTVPESVGLGDEVEGTYTAGNRTRVRLAVRISDRLPTSVTGGLRDHRIEVGVGESLNQNFLVRGVKRAALPLGAYGARVTTPLALLGVIFRYQTDGSIRVVPSMSGVSRYRLLAMQNHLDHIGVRSLRRKGEGQGFAGLRDYVIGDDPRHIDWKATARRRRTTTREFTIERSQTVLTVIDAGRSMTQLAGEWSRFEQALSSALILTDIAAQAGDKVGTLVFDDGIRAFVPATRSRGALQAVRDAFVPVTASTAEPDYATAFRFLSSKQRKRSLIVFYTDVLGVRASRSLLAHISRSAARHLALVVALRNDELFSAAIPAASGDVNSIYAHAAAEELILEREEALERMRRAGAVVLDVSPSVMTAAVVNRYLELKARGGI